MNSHPSPLKVIAPEGAEFMQSDGRIEKRATVKVPVRLVPCEDALTVEMTTTVNISRHGARILTSRRWRTGDQLTLTSLSGEIQRQCRVIYCCPLTEAQFIAGLEFEENAKNREGLLDRQTTI